MRFMLFVWAFSAFAGCASVSSTPSAPSAPQGSLPEYRRTPAAADIEKVDYKYDAKDTSCGGFPRLAVETAPGTCLGLVLPRSRAIEILGKRKTMLMRTMAPIAGTRDFLIVDMGGWAMGLGHLYRMVWTDGHYELRDLKSGLNLPHAVKLGPDGKFWINELNQISRFSLAADGSIMNWQPMIIGLPGFAKAAHPLTQFTFDPRNNDLYINFGSPSDHCFTEDKVTECPEIKGKDLAAIARVSWADLQNPPAKSWTVVARGLRNSVAMTISPAGFLIQGENGRDFSDSTEPFEEMNAVDLSKPAFNHGWPYCYDFRAASPDWLGNTVVRCDSALTPSREGDYAQPFILMPPHVAPLAAGYYHGAMFPQFEDKLLMAWHGYRKTGHRLVAYNVDSSGRPVLAPNLASSLFNVDRKEDGCPLKQHMDPAGGLVRTSPYTEIISRWNERKDLRPMGAPASFSVADDGSIWIVEDKNQSIVRLAKDTQKYAPEVCDPDADDRIELLAWRRAVLDSPTLTADYQELNTKLVQKYCAHCHDNGVDKSLTLDSMSGLDFLVNAKWFVAGKPARSRGLEAILHEGEVPAMPMAGDPNQFFGTPEGDEITKLVQRWISEVPTDVDLRYGKTKLNQARKVRSAPGGEICGQLLAGASAYIDPRKETFVTSGGWKWARLYLPPDHKALKGSACKWPQDGIFAIATEPAH